MSGVRHTKEAYKRALDIMGDEVTPLVRSIMEARIDGVGMKEVCAELEIEPGNAYSYCRRVLRRAAQRDGTTDATPGGVVPEGFHITGKSQMVRNEDGLPTWVKTAKDRERQIDELYQIIESGQGYKPFKPTKAPAKTDDTLLTLITITDFHLGMYAWEAESGEGWDMGISRDVFLNGVNDLIQASPKSGTGLLCQLGDFLHWDGLLAVTPSSGHILDADTRYGKLVDLAIQVMDEAIRLMLKKFATVHVIQAEGNHDQAGSVWMRKHCKHRWSDEPRVTVDDSEFPYYAYLHGQTMLGFHHGHKVKLAQMHKLFASEPRFREMWGKANQTYIHSGHYHHEKVVEDGGAIAEQHPTLAARDAYASRGGWVSRRGAKAITYHKDEGEIHRITVRPRQ